MNDGKKYCFGLLVLVLCFFGPVSASEYCRTSYSDYEFCSFGCCDSGLHYECCTDVGMIIGIVVGCLFALGFILCLVCVVCTLMKKNGSHGRVVHPVNTVVVPMVVSSTNYSQQPPYGQGYPYVGRQGNQNSTGNGAVNQPGYSPPYQQPTDNTWQGNNSNPAYPPAFPGNSSGSNQPPPPPPKYDSLDHSQT